MQWLTHGPGPTRNRPSEYILMAHPAARRELKMKVLSSLKSAKTRDRHCRVIRRKGRVYVINKRNPRMKARQG